MSVLFYKKGNELLKKLKIKTSTANNTKDIQSSRNFSAVLPSRTK